MLRHYKPLMPTSVDTYIEPFFGGGAMYVYVMNTYKPKYARINDINPYMMGLYNEIKTNLKSFMNRVDDLESKYIPLSKEDRKKLYYDLRKEYTTEYGNWNKTVDSATLYFLMKTAFNGIWQTTKESKGRFATPCGLLNQKDKVYDRDVVMWWHNALQTTDIYSDDWSVCCQGVSEKDVFFFFDPPYRESFADYGNGFSDQQLIDLIEFSNKQSNVMLSNRDDNDWFKNHSISLNFKHFDITYTAGRRKKTEDGYEAKKAREILLYRTTQGLTKFL